MKGFNRFKFLLLLSIRNTLRHWRRSLVVVILLMISLAGMIVYQAFYQGMMRQMVDNIVNIGIGHIQIYKNGRMEFTPMDFTFENPDSILSIVSKITPGVFATPRSRSYGLIVSPTTSTGIEINAVEPLSYDKVFPVSDYISDGSFSLNEKQIIIGSGIAKKLNVGINRKVVLMWSGEEGLVSEAYRVSGILKTPYQEVNDRIVFVNLPAFQKITGTENSVTEIILRVKSRKELPDVKNRVALAVSKINPELAVKSWRDIAPWLVSLIVIGDYSLYIYYVIILAAVVIGALSVFYMNIKDRTKEHGVLMALGLKPGELFVLIIMESLLITFVSMILGNLVADPVVLYFNRVGFDMSRFASGLEVFGLQARIHTPLTRLNLVLSNLIILLTGLIASLSPAHMVRKLKVVEALRFS